MEDEWLVFCEEAWLGSYFACRQVFSSEISQAAAFIVTDISYLEQVPLHLDYYYY